MVEGIDLDLGNQIDEFEMKPLTAGLGFHKKSVSLKEHISKAGLAEQAVRRALPSAPPTEFLEPKTSRSSREIIEELHEALKPRPRSATLSPTLPRDIDPAPARPMIPDPTVPEQRPSRPRDPLSRVNFQIPNQSINESAGTASVRRGAHDNLVRPLSPVAVSFSAIVLDGIVVLAISLIFLVGLVVATGIKLPSVIQSSQGEFTTQLSLFVLYLAVFEMYAIVARSFFGATIGEWTFDLQLGDEKQIQKAHYPALVLWRSLMNLLTGLVLLPVFSLLLNRDLAARLSGLQLYKRN